MAYRDRLAKAGILCLALLLSSRVAGAATPQQNAVDELALLNRILASAEIALLGPDGHVSIRDPSNPNRYFIAVHMPAALVTRGDIYQSDLDGRPVQSTKAALLDERFIDGEIYKTRPDVNAIVVTARPELVAFSVSSVPLRLGKGAVPIFDIRKIDGGKHGAVDSQDVGHALAQSLGRGESELLFGEGAVVASPSATDLVRSALKLRATAEQEIFERGVGGTLRHLTYTRDKAIPEAGGKSLGPSGGVERGDRFTAFYNFLGARDLLANPAPTHAPPENGDQALIRDLVIANRLLVSPEMGVLTPDGLAHISVRSRSNPNHFFIARDFAPGMVTASDIIEDDLDTKPVNGARVPQYSERFIHAEIYRARPDVMAVLHAHTPELRTFGQSSVKLRPVTDKALFLTGNEPIFDITQFTGGAPSPVGCSWCVSTPELGHDLAGVMGKSAVVLLLDHGIAMGGASLRQLVIDAYNLRLNAKIEELAIALGGEVGAFDSLATRRTASAGQTVPEWDYWKQRLLGSTNLDAAPKPEVGLPPLPKR